MSIPQPMLSLPIDAYLDGIESQLKREKSLVLVAEPGAGKTTRVPAYLLTRRSQKILVLEPRRVAARLTAARVADELREPLGKRVGYAVRGERVGDERTQLLFLTEGLLIRRLLRDPNLDGVGTVVLDEFHERSIHTDLAIGLVRRLQQSTRPDLELLVMSATLDADKVSRYLAAPIVSASGRTFPVDVDYVDVQSLPSRSLPLEQAIHKALRKVLDHPVGGTGHALVFLPGAREIRRASEVLRSFARPVFLLHGDMRADEQARVLQPSAPKVILATNVAETSITIDGVTAVIDSGLARVARFSPFSGLPELEVEKTSKASCIQRAGRAGRMQAGYALRVFSKHDFDTRNDYLLPELLRSDLTDAHLTFLLLGISWREFSFFEAPRSEQIDHAEKLAARLGLTTTTKGPAITELGRAVARMPIHPRLGRTFIATAAVDVGERGAVAVAVLDQRERAPSSSHAVHDSESDTLDCVDAFFRGDLLPFAARNIDGTQKTLTARTPDRNLEPHLAILLASRSSDEVVRQALLLGFPDRVAKRLKERGDGKQHFALSDGGSFVLSDRSAVRTSEWILASSILTRDGVAQCEAATAIDPAWLYEFFIDDLSERDVVQVDKNTGVVSAKRAVFYGALAVEEKIIDAKDSPEATRALAEYILKTGLHLLTDMDELTQLRRRIICARKVADTLRELDEVALKEVVLATCRAKRSVAEASRERFLDHVAEHLGYDSLRRVDELAPRFLTLAGRRQVPIHYEADRPAWVESRMQDFFGLRAVPQVAGQDLVVHLLAPNKRAEQVTQDLPNFWKVHYPSLRGSLMRRYPRHAWPEDPTVPLPPTPEKR